MADAAELLDEIELQCGDVEESGGQPALVELGHEEFEALRSELDGDELELLPSPVRRSQPAQPSSGAQRIAHYRLKVRQVDQPSHLSVIAAPDES